MSEHDCKIGEILFIFLQCGSGWGGSRNWRKEPIEDQLLQLKGIKIGRWVTVGAGTIIINDTWIIPLL
jgi:hypothetical protein